MSAKSLAPPQLSSESMTSPDQFRIVDAHTLEVTLPKPDRLALANLCVPYAVIMINSKLVETTRHDRRSLGFGLAEIQQRGERRLYCRKL